MPILLGVLCLKSEGMPQHQPIGLLGQDNAFCIVEILCHAINLVSQVMSWQRLCIAIIVVLLRDYHVIATPFALQLLQSLYYYCEITML